MNILAFFVEIFCDLEIEFLRIVARGNKLKLRGWRVGGGDLRGGGERDWVEISKAWGFLYVVDEV